MMREQRDEVEEGGRVRAEGELVSFDSRASHANFS